MRNDMMNKNKSHMEFVWTMYETFNRMFHEYWYKNYKGYNSDLEYDSFCTAYEALLEHVINSLVLEMKDRDLDVDKILKKMYDKRIRPEMDRILKENIQEVLCEKGLL